ncbi:hypothetical protein BRADI_1g70933v3 [Brachypodium distachyon]|uniref:Uncharacterized protein n=1 Tax=Brachypodium distachyon TaxID=15368 RepID=A0A2K2DUK0_BRADI|nr:hypothetical protein BRADI_1g70933v3 [Brachypodium distachyon]
MPMYHRETMWQYTATHSSANYPSTIPSGRRGQVDPLEKKRKKKWSGRSIRVPSDHFFFLSLFARSSSEFFFPLRRPDCQCQAHPRAYDRAQFRDQPLLVAQKSVGTAEDQGRIDLGRCYRSARPEPGESFVYSATASQSFHGPRRRIFICDLWTIYIPHGSKSPSQPSQNGHGAWCRDLTHWRRVH